MLSKRGALAALADFLEGPQLDLTDPFSRTPQHHPNLSQRMGTTIGHI